METQGVSLFSDILAVGGAAQSDSMGHLQGSHAAWTHLAAPWEMKPVWTRLHISMGNLESCTIPLCAALCPGGCPKIRRLSVENKRGRLHNCDLWMPDSTLHDWCQRIWRRTATSFTSHTLCDLNANLEFFVCINLHLGFTQSEEVCCRFNCQRFDQSD